MDIHSVLLLVTVTHQGKRASPSAAPVWATVLYPTSLFPHQLQASQERQPRGRTTPRTGILNNQGMYSTNKLHSLSLVDPKCHNQKPNSINWTSSHSLGPCWTQKLNPSLTFFFDLAILVQFFFFNLEQEACKSTNSPPALNHSRLTQFWKSTGLACKQSCVPVCPPGMEQASQNCPQKQYSSMDHLLPHWTENCHTIMQLHMQATSESGIKNFFQLTIWWAFLYLITEQVHISPLKRV